MTHFKNGPLTMKNVSPVSLVRQTTTTDATSTTEVCPVTGQEKGCLRLAEPVFPMDNWYRYQVQSMIGLKELPSDALVHTTLAHVSLGMTGQPRGELL
jgi:hypothetical protein